MKKILITGENSFIGNSFYNYLKQLRFEDRYSIDKVSLRNTKLNELSFAGYDAILNVAGIAHIDSGHLNPEEKLRYKRINEELPGLVAKKAREEGVPFFIHMSSMAVFGESAGLGKEKIIHEDMLPNPQSVYASTKLEGEKRVQGEFARGLKGAIVRSPMVYGRGAKGNYPMLSKAAGLIPFFPNIENERSMIYIENLCELLRQLIERERPGIFHPQNAEPVCTSKLVFEIARAKGKKIILFKDMNWLLKFLSGRVRILNKIFGNFIYDETISYIPEIKYQIVGFRESIERTERKK